MRPTMTGGHVRSLNCTPVTCHTDEFDDGPLLSLPRQLNYTLYYALQVGAGILLPILPTDVSKSAKVDKVQISTAR
jgi:hypothetical protein